MAEMTHRTGLKNPWIIIPQPNPQARLRLFCFPYAGGSASIYRTWGSLLPANIEVVSVQLPGRGARFKESPISRIFPLVQVLAEVLPPYRDKPFAFFGHSMGALISFELARQLRRQQQSGPMHLLVSGRRAAHLPDPDPPVHNLPEAEFIQEFRRLNGTPQAVLEEEELMQIMLPLLRADFAVGETYQYTSESPLSCPISAFGGLQDEEASRSELAAWGEQTSAAFSLDMFPGDHFFLHSVQSLLIEVLFRQLKTLVSRLG